MGGDRERARVSTTRTRNAHTQVHPFVCATSVGHFALRTELWRCLLRVAFSYIKRRKKVAAWKAVVDLCELVSVLFSLTVPLLTYTLAVISILTGCTSICCLQ